jgi:mono/diheme cytochrome c family protein
MRRLAFTPIALTISLALAACGGTGAVEDGAGSADAGRAAYASTCIPCHGADARGLPGLGKDLTTSNFLAQRSDQEIVDFLKSGRRASDPLNTTGVDMPPRGGNPALSDGDLMNIVVYLRTLRR